MIHPSIPPVIRSRWLAGESCASLAEDYAISVEEVEKVLRGGFKAAHRARGLVPVHPGAGAGEPAPPAATEQPDPQGDVTTHLRQHAETYAPVAGNRGQHPTPPECYPESTGWWQDALARVRTQFLLGALRYGMPEPGRAARWDWIGRIEQEVVRYRATGEPGCLTEILACALGEYADRGWHLQRWESRGDDTLKTREV